jgi:hypothetical protein
MQGLLPIIRRARRSLILPEEPAVKVAAPLIVLPPDKGAEKPLETVPLDATENADAPRPLQTPAAS